MIPSLRVPALLLLVAAFGIEGGGVAQAQIQRVNVMPGYPNVPRTSPGQRRPVRPADNLILWGSANDGDGSAVGFTYTWEVSPGPDVAVVDDGSLTGTVQDSSFITETVTFSLLNGRTNGLASATLRVSDGVTSREDTVQIAIIDATDPLSDTPIKHQQLEVNIAIEDALRFLYQNQLSDGSWSGYLSNRIGTTSYAIWAIQNQGHLATNDPDQDIFAERVKRGLNYNFSQCQIITNLNAPNADMVRGAVADQISDMNQNQEAVSFGNPGSGNWGYWHPIATAALAATVSPNEVVTVGAAAGKTYREFGEDCLDMIGIAQTDSGPYRGGWRYTSNAGNSDMSVNSWHYIAMEGLYITFGVELPDWILQECEINLVYHQWNLQGPRPFGYTSTNPLGGYSNGHATTGGGLSGLCSVELQGPHTSPGTIIGAEPGPLNSIQAKRDAALEFLGDEWGGTGCAHSSGQMGNTYYMWSVARGLRMTAFSMGFPSGSLIPLVNNGVVFDWQTGEEGGTGNLAPPGSAREGYFSYLERTQAANGGWTFCWGNNLDTAMAVLILTPKVFLVEPPNDGPGEDLHCEEFNRTETLTANDTLTLLTLAHNPEAAQGFAYVHAVDSDGDPVAFDHLLGQVLIVNGIEGFDYSVNAVDYRAAVAEGSATDSDADGILDLDGVEYEMTAGELLIPRFFGQSSNAGEMTPFKSDLVLIGLTGGNKFTTTADFLVYNDNEEVFSTEHAFDCWDKRALGDISGVFTNSFLRDTTDHDELEPIGFPQYETGWMRIDGGMASSSAVSFPDPAVYAVLIDHANAFGAADLPFEICRQGGQLLPRSVLGDASGAGPLEDCGVSLRRREPASLLLMPEFDNRNGVATVYTVTNQNPADGVDVHFVYIGKYGS